jgi:hypothetical protein
VQSERVSFRLGECRSFVEAGTHEQIEPAKVGANHGLTRCGRSLCGRSWFD